MSESNLTILLEQQTDYQFLIKFPHDKIPSLVTDEGEPLGKGEGPSPSHMLAVAIANCLSASLLFALRKFKNQPEPVKAAVHLELARNEANRLRIGRIQVDIQVGQSAEMLTHLDRILETFEDFCVVTQSVRSGFPINVNVTDSNGKVLK